MNKKFTYLGVSLFSLLGILMLSCGSTPSIQKNQYSDSLKKKARERAFVEVVNALHAPYSKGDKFFRIFTGETDETKEGSAVSVKDGDDSIGGKGTWKVKAGKDNTQQSAKEDFIVYTYTGFQPKGSKIVIDGKMTSMYRSQEIGSPFKDSIGFKSFGRGVKQNNKIVYSMGSHKDEEVKIGENGVKDIKESTTDVGSYLITLADTLTISGEYQATLEFIYPDGRVFLRVTESNYESYLIGDDDENEGMFTAVGSIIEFTYDGKTEKLTKDEIKKLITVA